MILFSIAKVVIEVDQGIETEEIKIRNGLELIRTRTDLTKTGIVTVIEAKIGIKKIEADPVTKMIEADLVTVIEKTEEEADLEIDEIKTGNFIQMNK